MLNRLIDSYHFVGVVKMLNQQAMTLPFIKSIEIPTPQVLSPRARMPKPELVTAGIGIVCALVVRGNAVWFFSAA